MTELPAEFLKRMERELKEEYPSFFATYSLPPFKGVRVNTLKISPEEFKRICPFPLGESVPWEPNGFYTGEEKVGRYIEHFMGLFYSQEPSAMYPAPLLEVRPGERVLDLCAAPGGKGTRLCEATGGDGVVVLNEYVSARAKILSKNVERLGIKNAVVVNESPDRLRKFFPCWFDKILVDAPCSGEGMFKKNEEEAVANWNEENISACAARQKDILSAAADMLKGGGRLVYSTCTFSHEEDERQTEAFISLHPDFRLISEKKFYPHKVRGEGHYCAVFEKKAGGESYVKLTAVGLDKKTEKLYNEFEENFLNIRLKNLYKAGDFIYSLPDGMFSMYGLNILRAGLKVAEEINGRIEPAHSLSLALKKEEVKNFADVDKAAAERYLRGETVVSDGSKGWCVVGYNGFPLGLGKISGGIIKNHYPKGLRMIKN